MKYLLVLMCSAVLSLSVSAQQYVTKAGMTHFFSSAPMENIEATSHSSVCAMNTTTKKVFAKISIKTFEFPNKLMQEHFNENYMESDKYPAATLDGIIVEPIDWSKDGTVDVTIHGTLDIHGVKQERDIKAKLTLQGGAPIRAIATWDVKLIDHKIKVPTVVVAHIAEVIAVNVDYTFEKYEKK